MLKIIIPLAGNSDLFSNAGYAYPKPLIDIQGKPMIEWVLDNPAKTAVPYQFIFIIKEEDVLKYHLDNTLKLLSPGADIVRIKRPAKGGLCSVLMAVDKIDADDSLLILNGDQVIDIDFNQLLHYWQKQSASAGLVTFSSVHPRWSYARIENEEVVQTAEKNPISKYAIAGYYYFEKAADFLRAAFQSIRNDVQLEGMYYISPVINEMVLMNKRVVSFSIEKEQYHSFYSPQMLNEFERTLVR